MAHFERRASFEASSRLSRTLSFQSQHSLVSHHVDETEGAWETPLPSEIHPVSAAEVSTSRRILQIVTAVVYCLLGAGVVFGFAALKPVLIREGVYKGLCTAEELKEGVYVCYGQEVRLNLMFTTAAVSTNVCALPVGAVLDRFGPRVASIIGCMFLATGTMLLAFAPDVSLDIYIPGYLFLALGGPFVFIPAFQLSNAFPRNSGLILALLTGAFDTSSAILLIFRIVYERSGGAFKPKHFFLVYLAVPVFILLAQIFVMPSKSYKTATVPVNQEAPQDQPPAESTPLLPEPIASSENGDNSTGLTKPKPSPLTGVLHHLPATHQILTPYWILIALFTVIQMTRINYFITTIRTQYTHLLNPPMALQVNQIFDVLLPLGGVVSIPFIGLILDNLPIYLVLASLVGIATVIGVLGTIPDLGAAYAGIVLFVLYRPLYYTAISDYSAKVFGFETFGKVYGLIICLAGIGNFSQAGLDALTHRVFGDDPVPVNVGLTVLAGSVGVLLVGYIWRKTVLAARKERG